MNNLDCKNNNDVFSKVQKFPRIVELNLGNGSQEKLNLNQCITIGSPCLPCGNYNNQPSIPIADESFSTTRPNEEIKKRNFCESVKSCNNGQIINR